MSPAAVAEPAERAALQSDFSDHNPRSKVSFNGENFEVDLHVEDFKPEVLFTIYVNNRNALRSLLKVTCSI